LTIALFAAPAFAQDEGGGGGLPSSIFAGADFGPANRGGDKPNPMDAIKRFFAQAKVTLTGDQERAIRPIVEAAFSQVQDLVEKAGPAGGGERAARGGGERRGGGGGRGRGGFGGADPAANNPELAAQLQKINDDVLTRIVAVLKADQQAAFKNWQSEEIKKGGGFAALKVIMEEAGAPLTAAQEPQIRALYLQDTQQRVGATDPAKLAEIEKTTMTNVVKLLTPEQRKALLASRAKQ